MLRHILDFKETQLAERLDWDNYFMSIAVLASCRSSCERLHVGSVIVKNNRLIAMGYNGFISGSPHVSHIENGHEQSTIHSEVNAITDCARRGVSLDGSTIYITHYPCINCFKTIIASGIRKILYLNDYNNNSLVEQLASECQAEIQKLI
jgi:dCMP deaminase